MKTMRWWVCLLRLWCGSRAEEGSSELAVQYHLAGQGWVEDTLYFGADCDVDRLAASWAKWHVDEVAECGSVGCAAQTIAAAMRARVADGATGRCCDFVRRDWVGARRPAGDRSATAAYLASAGLRRVSLGSGPPSHVLERACGRLAAELAAAPGGADAATARRDAEAVGCWDETWLHVDVNMPQPPGHFMALAGAAGPHGAPLEAHTLRWNLTEPLPFGDSAFDDVYSEHALEHLPPRDVVGFLAEAWRVLRAGGTLRLSTPDLAKFAVAYVDRATDRRFLDERAALFPPRDCPWEAQLLGGGASAAAVVNGVMRNGHTFIWDVESLGFALEAGGVPRSAIHVDSFRSAYLPHALRTADMPIREHESLYLRILKPRLDE